MSLMSSLKIKRKLEDLQRWEDNIATRLNSPNINIDMTLTQNIYKQALIMAMSERGIPFKIYNLGCGVTRITTDTNTCPCCGKTL
jgi:hypothetical protein